MLVSLLLAALCATGCSWLLGVTGDPEVVEPPDLEGGDEISPPLFMDAPAPPRKDAAIPEAGDGATEDADDGAVTDPDI